MRAVVYSRVSKDDRADGRSVGEQEQECREAAAEHGWTVVETFSDDDRSASRYATRVREDYGRLLAYLAAAAVDLLVLWESSRGDRELESWAGLLNLCRTRGVKIHVYTHRKTYDLEVARDWKTLAEDGVDSAYESEKTRERVLRGVRKNAAAGRPHGRLQYGYVRLYDSRGEFIEQVKHLEQAAVIVEAARRVRAGESLYAIAQDFQERGIPTPREGLGWRPEQIGRLVKNPAYAGQRVHRGQIVGKAVWPAIIDEQVFAECVARLADPGRRTVRDNRAKHLLTGVSRCAHCDSRMFVQKAPRGAGTQLVCRGDFCAAAKEQPVEDFVTDMVIARLSRDDFLDLYAGPGSAAAGGAQAEADDLRLRLKGFYAASAAGKVSPEGLAAIEADLLPQIEAAAQRAVVVPVPAVLRDAAGPKAREAWEGFTLDQRRLVVRLLVEIRISRAGRGTRYFHQDRLAASRWVGDTRTWGEMWAEASLR